MQYLIYHLRYKFQQSHFTLYCLSNCGVTSLCVHGRTVFLCSLFLRRTRTLFLLFTIVWVLSFRVIFTKSRPIVEETSALFSLPNARSSKNFRWTSIACFLKVKISLSNTWWVLGIGDLALKILKLGTRWRWKHKIYLPVVLPRKNALGVHGINWPQAGLIVSLDSAGCRSQVPLSSNLNYSSSSLCCFIVWFPVGEKPTGG